MKMSSLGKKVLLFSVIFLGVCASVIGILFCMQNTESEFSLREPSWLNSKAQIKREGGDENFFSISNKLNEATNLSLEEKIAIEKRLNQQALEKNPLTPMSGKVIYEKLLGFGVDLDPAFSERLLSDSMTADDWNVVSIYAAQLLSEEANFLIELSQYRNFSELKKAFDQRSRISGQFYGNELLSQPMAYREITVEDIVDILESGASLPSSAIKYIIHANNIDIAVQLKNAGYGVDVTYMDEYRSMTAVEIMAERVAINPSFSSVDEHIDNFEKLLSLGFPVKIEDGSRDALDYVLAAVYGREFDEAKNLLLMANYLNEKGIYLEKSHMELVERIRLKYPHLYEEYLADLK